MHNHKPFLFDYIDILPTTSCTLEARLMIETSLFFWNVKCSLQGVIKKPYDSDCVSQSVSLRLHSHVCVYSGIMKSSFVATAGLGKTNIAATNSTIQRPKFTKSFQHFANGSARCLRDWTQKDKKAELCQHRDV